MKSHLLVLATNPFLHQLIKSSWVPGEISTFLMPQHSVKDMLLEFSIPKEIVSVCMDEEMERQTSSPDKETEYAFGEIKVEEPEDEEEVYVDVTSDCQNAEPQNIDQQHPEHPPDNNGESDQHIEPGEIFREDKVAFEFEEINDETSSKKRLQPESLPSISPSAKMRKRNVEVDEKPENCEFTAEDIPEDELIVELFGDNADNIDINLDETVTSDDPSSFGLNEEIDVERTLTRNVTNAQPSDNVGKRQGGDRSSQCDQCAYATTNSSILRRHLKTHDREKPNKCQQCDFASSRADHLRRHLKTHIEEKSVKCNQCSYESSGNLRKHLKTHENPEKSKKLVDHPENLDEELVQLEDELTSVDLLPGFKVVGCLQNYSGCGKRSINKGVFWLVPSHKKAKDLDPLKESVLFIHVVSRGRPPLAIFIEESVNAAELISAVLEIQKKEKGKDPQASQLLVLSFADVQLAPEKEIGIGSFGRGATFVLSSKEDDGSKVENHTGHLLFCSDCKPNRHPAPTPPPPQHQNHDHAIHAGS